MKNKKSDGRRAVVNSDKYLSESGLQGGKVLGNRISLVSFISGIPLFAVGFFAMFSIIFDLGFPTNSAAIISAVLVTVIGLLLILGGYSTLRRNRSGK